MISVLVINCGSSSLKFQVFDMTGVTVKAKGIVERIGDSSKLRMTVKGQQQEINDRPVRTHEEAVEMILDVLTGGEEPVIKSAREINAVGHRVVHGGTVFSGPALVDKAVKKAIKRLEVLAPLHNPPALKGIIACEKNIPNVPQVAVFDTAFHHTLPKKAYLYSIPYEFYEKYGVRKYGFHGTSHKFVARRTADILKRPLEELKIITCHLGSGASITAIQNGKSVDTSMGFTPLEGLTMGTRCGDIDPSIVTFIMEKEGMSADEVREFLNRKCGVLGISGISSDFRDLEKAALKGNVRAITALKVFIYDVKRYICSYIGILNGLDALVFTAGLGENSPFIRQQICRNMSFLGLEVDASKNESECGEQSFISKDTSRPILVVPTNEELMIAVDTADMISEPSRSFA